MRRLLFLFIACVLGFSLTTAEASTPEPQKASPPLTIDRQTNLVIRDLIITNASGNGITVRNSKNIQIVNCCIAHCVGEAVNISSSSRITISSNLFETVRTGVYALNSQTIVITHNRCRNVQGPMPRGQFAQFDKVTGPGNQISSNLCQNVLGASHPEDVINIYKSQGTAHSPIMIIGNRIRGGGPSASGGGIMTGDGGGSYIVVKENVLVDPGQYGIAIAGGDHIQVVRNKVFGKKQPFTNVGIYIWNQYSPPCHSHTVENNDVRWTNRDGNDNPAWKADNCGTVLGWDQNTWHAPFDNTLLPESLW